MCNRLKKRRRKKTKTLQRKEEGHSGPGVDVPGQAAGHEAFAVFSSVSCLSLFSESRCARS